MTSVSHSSRLDSFIFACMAHKKLIRFAELETFPNVLQFPKNIKGKWNEFFRNKNPIVLELACGKGEYAVGMASLYKDKNFIGVDVKGNRIWVGARTSLEKNLQNVGFLRTEIDQVNEYFSANEVAEIWITFPDPQLRKSKAKKRLTHPKFLRLYQQFLLPGSYIHVKTDSPDLYNFTKKVVEMYGCTLANDFDDLYRHPNISEEMKIKTHYESLDIAQSKRVFYLCFSLPEQLPGRERDEELKQMMKNAE
jgi:tRNA (guanine-N7-)-methyltransferase